MPVEDPRGERYPEFAKYETPRTNRSEAERDRDRIHYTTALRRLVGVTQVASAAEGHVFHNRLTHTFEVAQIARRLAQYLRGDHLEDRADRPSRERLLAVGGLDPDVVEAAALAHDLGHPPFGHLAEQELDRLVHGITDSEGFEGNAQSFRIVTRLAQRHPSFDGLNLTRATLSAIMKYPWLWQDRPEEKADKWGAYETETEFFRFARHEGSITEVPSLEAQIMDLADDIAYAVHDVEDFYKAGLIPLDILSRSDDEGQSERERFVSGIFDRFAQRERRPPVTLAEARILAGETLQGFFGDLETRFLGTSSQRRRLRTVTAALIGRYVRQSCTLGQDLGEPLVVNAIHRKELFLLKQLTWHYVIEGPNLTTQQEGQRRIVADLFAIYHAAIEDKRWWLLPAGFHTMVEAAYAHTENEQRVAARLAADFIAGLSEQEALALHRRVTGVETGRLLFL